MSKVLIACFTGDSGLTDYSVSLARQWRRFDSVTLITGRSLSPQLQALLPETNLFFDRSRWYPIDILRFAWHVLRRRPSVVLFQAPLKVPLVEGLLVRCFRWLGIRCVLTIHDVLPHYPRAWHRHEYAWFYRCFDRLVVHSEAARTAVEGMGVRSPMLVVPHGVYDLFRLKSPARSQARRTIGWRAYEDAFAVLFFGHLEPRKGLVDVLTLAERWRDRQDIVFVIAGHFDARHHPPEVAQLLERVSALPNVLLRNERIPFEEVENYFCASDLVLLPYHEGSTSGVLKLAVAFELPVLASRVGDFPEQVPQGAGVWVDPGADLADQMAEALPQAMANRASMAVAMKGAAARCSWVDIAASYSAFVLADE